ncbi:MAG TPA: metallophosphoesterase, partial [Sorangium sp.]|nr:metallophosphoesterase [Sorangium sp.]
MKLFALSDLHVGYAENRWAIERITPRPNDWLILAGDLGETEQHLLYVFDTLGPRFKQLVWTPGNHELYTMPSERGGPRGLRGQARYERLVELCRSRGVI